MADEQIVEDVVEETKDVTEDDLRAAKYGKAEVENESSDESADTKTKPNEDESEDTDEPDQKSDESEDEESPTFTKKFLNIKGDTPEEYIANLEKSYENSTSEALRLKDAVKPKTDTEDDEESPPINPYELYAKRQMDKELVKTFNSFKKDYPQASDPVEYERFTKKVALISKATMDDGELLDFPDLFRSAAGALGWEKETPVVDKVGQAIKNSGASSKTNSATKPTSKSKVTDGDIEVYRKLHGSDKPEAEIRKELEPFTK